MNIDREIALAEAREDAAVEAAKKLELQVRDWLFGKIRFALEGECTDDQADAWADDAADQAIQAWAGGEDADFTCNTIFDVLALRTSLTLNQAKQAADWVRDDWADLSAELASAELVDIVNGD